jgi:hypothetical protein
MQGPEKEILSTQSKGDLGNGLRIQFEKPWMIESKRCMYHMVDWQRRLTPLFRVSGGAEIGLARPHSPRLLKNCAPWQRTLPTWAIQCDTFRRGVDMEAAQLGAAVLVMTNIGRVLKQKVISMELCYFDISGLSRNNHFSIELTFIERMDSTEITI